MKIWHYNMTPHTLPSRTSYGVSIVSILKKICCLTLGQQCVVLMLAAPPRPLGTQINFDYRQTSNISCTLVGNKIVDHSDVVGALHVHSRHNT